MICKICGNEFEPFRQRKVFCSKACLDQSEKNKAKERWKQRGVPKKCQECGEEFCALGSAVTCSLQCGNARRRRQAKSYVSEDRVTWKIKDRPKKKYITDYAAIDSGFF